MAKLSTRTRQFILPNLAKIARFPLPRWTTTFERPQAERISLDLKLELEVMNSVSVNHRLPDPFKTLFSLYNQHTCYMTSLFFDIVYQSMPYRALSTYTLVLQYICKAEAGVMVKTMKSQEQRVMTCPLQ